MANNQTAINVVCRLRGLPKIKKGWRCEVDGEPGIVFGGDHSGNLNIKFDAGDVSNCHPGWRMKIWDASGNLVYASPDDN